MGGLTASGRNGHQTAAEIELCLFNEGYGLDFPEGAEKRMLEKVGKKVHLRR